MVCIWEFIVCWVESLVKGGCSVGGTDSQFEDRDRDESYMVGECKLVWFGVSG